MEGPSLVIAVYELEPFLQKKITHASGSSPFDWESFKGQKLIKVYSWGKHLLLQFTHITLRIHFLLWGSYRIDNPKENQRPRMQLRFSDHQIYFYSCSIKELEAPFEELYDWSSDIMSPLWDPVAAREKILKHPEELLCDLLLDQDIFSGVGNIIKNEVLFQMKLHPETRVKDISKKKISTLIEATRNYSLQFFEWKLHFVLRKHWLIVRKKTCPLCGGPVTRKKTGKKERISHYCEYCQLKP